MCRHLSFFWKEKKNLNHEYDEEERRRKISKSLIRLLLIAVDVVYGHNAKYEQYMGEKDRSWVRHWSNVNVHMCIRRRRRMKKENSQIHERSIWYGKESNKCLILEAEFHIGMCCCLLSNWTLHHCCVLLPFECCRKISLSIVICHK